MRCVPRFGPAYAAAFCALTVALGGRAAADDEVALMSRPAAFTDVIDAADTDGDAFDLTVRVGFARRQSRGSVSREVPSASGREETIRYAQFVHVRHELNVGIDLGLFRDLALSVDLPLVLTDERRLNGRAGAAPDLRRSEQPQGQDDSLVMGLTDDTRFVSPLRSGVDRIRFSLAWAPLNQFRRPESPTWVIRAGGSLALGSLLTPCARGDRGCGVSDGTHSAFAETRFSRRYRYAEPYGALALRARFVGSGEANYLPSGPLRGVPSNRPPIEVGFTVGVALVPWEHRGRHQRFALDLFARGEWVSGGRDYTPLFDGLGTSDNPLLANSSCEGVARPGTDDCTPDSSGLRSVP